MLKNKKNLWAHFFKMTRWWLLTLQISDPPWPTKFHRRAQVTPARKRKHKNILWVPVHIGRRVPHNRQTQILEDIIINGSVHTGWEQHQRVCTQICMQICFRVLCEWGLNSALSIQVSSIYIVKLPLGQVPSTVLVGFSHTLLWHVWFKACLR